MRNHSKSLVTATLVMLMTLCFTVLRTADAAAQKTIYNNGNVKIVLFDGEWRMMHGDNVVAHGDGPININDLPPAFNDILQYYAKLPLEMSPKKSLSKATASTYGPLVRSMWVQDSPYNDLFPLVDGVRTLTGCASITSGQILCYYGYCKPINAIGSNTTTYSTLQSPYITNLRREGSTYTYDYQYSYTPDFEKIAIDPSETAKFVLAIAFLQKGAFKTEATSTAPKQQIDAFNNTYGYKTESRLLTSLSEGSYIANAIKSGHPVLLSSYNEHEGHSYIIDGFNGVEFHFNYGWGGYCDGWFTTSTYPKNLYMTVCYPDDANYVTMKATPKYLHIVSNGTDNKYEMAFSGNNPLSFKQKTSLTLNAGTYEFYFEYADGTKIAPYAPKTINVKNSVSKLGYFVNKPAKFSIDNTYKIDFYHNVNKNEILIETIGRELIVSGKVLDHNSNPIAGALVGLSDTKPEISISTPTQIGNSDILQSTSDAIIIPFVAYHECLTQVNIEHERMGAPKGFTVSILNSKDEVIAKKREDDNEILNIFNINLPVIFDENVKLDIGHTYYLKIQIEDYCNVANSITCSSFTLHTYENYFAKTAADGSYKFPITKNSTAKLYAIHSSYVFEPLKINNIQNNTQGQNFMGESNTVAVSGKVLDKKSIPLAGAYISTSASKPNVSITNSVNNKQIGYIIMEYGEEISFKPTKPFLTQIDIAVKKDGNPHGLNISLSDNKKVIWQKKLTDNEISSDAWTQIIIDTQLTLTIGNTYKIKLVADSQDDISNGYFYMYDDDDRKFAYQIWASDENVTVTDRNGKYSIQLDRGYSGSLYAYYNNKTFSPLSFANINGDLQNQDFKGDFSTPVSELSPNAKTQARIWSHSDMIIVENAGSSIFISDINGRIVKTIKPDNQHIEIPISIPGIYIVKTATKTQKVMVR